VSQEQVEGQLWECEKCNNFVFLLPSEPSEWARCAEHGKMTKGEASK